MHLAPCFHPHMAKIVHCSHAHHTHPFQVYLPCILPSKKRYVGFMYESPLQTAPTLDVKVHSLLALSVDHLLSEEAVDAEVQWHLALKVNHLFL